MQPCRLVLWQQSVQLIVESEEDPVFSFLCWRIFGLGGCRHSRGLCTGGLDLPAKLKVVEMAVSKTCDDDVGFQLVCLRKKWIRAADVCICTPVFPVVLKQPPQSAGRVTMHAGNHPRWYVRQYMELLPGLVLWKRNFWIKVSLKRNIWVQRVPRFEWSWGYVSHVIV